MVLGSWGAPLQGIPLLYIHLPCTAEKELRVLNLAHNRISGFGLQEMVHGLFLNVTLVHLDLSYNSIRDNGGVPCPRNSLSAMGALAT